MPEQSSRSLDSAAAAILALRKAGITSFANRFRSSNWTSSGVPSGVAHTTRSTPGIALFDRLQQLENVGWRAGEETAGLHRILDAAAWRWRRAWGRASPRSDRRLARARGAARRTSSCSPRSISPPRTWRLRGSWRCGTESRARAAEFGAAQRAMPVAPAGTS